MKTKKAALNYLEFNYGTFLESLCREYKSFRIDGNIDFIVDVFTLKNEEFAELAQLPLLNIHFYTSMHCGCVHDCCGCISSVSIDIINNKNGYITIFVHTCYNY